MWIVANNFTALWAKSVDDKLIIIFFSESLSSALKQKKGKDYKMSFVENFT